MRIIDICLYAYILLKPWYLSKSGTLQISDIFIILGFGLTVYKNFRKGNTWKKIEDNLIYFIIFVLLTFLINLLYSIKYSMSDFVKSSLYYLFIFMGLYTFRFKIYDKKFLKVTYYCFVIDLIIQFIAGVLGIGAIYGGSRYMGTFNDPNQFGFFIIMSMAYIYTIAKVLKLKVNPLIYILTVYLLYLSASTGMLLAVGSFLLIQIVVNIKSIFNNFKKYVPILLIIGILISLICSIVFIIYKTNDNVKEKIDIFVNKKILNSSIVKRVSGKINKIDADSNNFLEDRHLDKLVNNPIYMIYGAGQGSFDRFGNNSGEIHSTFPSILFCYGLIPFMILSYWIYINLKGLSIMQLSPYIAIFIESFTLVNNRQVLFWVLIIMANLYKDDRSNINENKENKKNLRYAKDIN